MKKKLLFSPLLLSPYGLEKIYNCINTNAIIQSGAVINDTSNSNNLNTIITGMVVVIIILLGTIMFAPKK